MKGVFNADLPTPKYNVIWKPEKKLSQGRISEKNLKEKTQLNLKTLTLKTITTQRRVQTI